MKSRSVAATVKDSRPSSRREPNLAYLAKIDILPRMPKIMVVPHREPALGRAALDLATSTDRLGQTTRYSRDADRELIQIEDPLGQTVTQGYNPAGKLDSITDPNGHATTFILDVQGREIAKQFADGTSQNLAYENSISLVARVTDALGQTTAYT